MIRVDTRYLSLLAGLWMLAGCAYAEGDREGVITNMLVRQSP